MKVSFFRIVGRLGASFGLLAGCSAGPADEPATASQTAAITLGSHLSGISDADFNAARDNFNLVEAIDDGVGPVMNEFACGRCHTLGAIGGSGEQIERRYGRVSNGIFSNLTNEGGSLRQLQTVGSFINGTRSCTVPLEREPADATVHNVGRLTTPLFGLGLVDAMPDSFFTNLAASEPAAVRGIVKTAAVLIPNPDDASQRIGTVRVARFGWKADISNLPTFAADAYKNEMGITTQHCFQGQSITAFSTESAPNGTPMPLGCDDLAPPAPAGVPAGTDDAVGPCAPGQTELQEDVENFTTFMTFLAPTERDLSDAIAVNAGAPIFNQIGCNGCHVTTTFRTPNPAPNGVPGGFAFNPFSDFLVHDMGTLGDGIGNDGDTVAVTRRMRTAPLWGIRFRNHLLHDGRTGDVATAILAHDGQGKAAATAFSLLSPSNQHNVVQFVRSL
ncbi:MAG TPA: di-heme oxidoredictase family protein [Kofleriaceae bacterium]|nr:di-heme oxidoredictase family protein [Kofleriaceae bacterium]